MSCMCLSVVTMGYSCNLLDVCFDDQFASSVNLCIGVGTRFRFDSPVEILGHSLKFFVLVEYMNLRLCDAYRIIIPTDTGGDIGVSR